MGRHPSRSRSASGSRRTRSRRARPGRRCLAASRSRLRRADRDRGPELGGIPPVHVRDGRRDARAERERSVDPERPVRLAVAAGADVRVAQERAALGVARAALEQLEAVGALPARGQAPGDGGPAAVDHRADDTRLVLEPVGAAVGVGRAVVAGGAVGAQVDAQPAVAADGVALDEHVARHQVERRDGQEAHAVAPVEGDDVALSGLLAADEVLPRAGHEHAVGAVAQRRRPVALGADEVALDDGPRRGDAEADAGAVVRGHDVPVRTRRRPDAHVASIHEDAAAVVAGRFAPGPVDADEVAHHATAVRAGRQLDAAREPGDDEAPDDDRRVRLDASGAAGVVPREDDPHPGVGARRRRCWPWRPAGSSRRCAAAR